VVVAVIVMALARTAWPQELSVTVPSPNGGDPAVFMGEYVLRGTSPDAVVVVGYWVANKSEDKEWMLLDVGMTPVPGTSAVLKREDVRLILPDGSEVPLPSQKEFQQSYSKIRNLDAIANRSAYSINYLPAYANIPCRIGFFTDMNDMSRGPAYDQVTLNQAGACFGRLYFPVEGGIQMNQVYTLAIRFPNSDLQIAMPMMTEDQIKDLKKKIKDAEREAKKNK
jgi:hypothetical protein